MDLIIEFVTENYVWIIVAGIVLLMAVVGYIADKTDFGRNKIEKEPKTKKEDTLEEIDNGEVKVDNNEIEVEDKKEKKEKKKKEKKEKKKKEKVVEELPIIETTIETSDSENIEQTISENVDPGFTFQNTDNVTEQSQIDQSLFEPLPSMDSVFTEQPAEQNNGFISTEPVNVNLTSEENQNSTVEADEDIWKF